MGESRRRPGIVPVRLDLADKERDRLRLIALTTGRSMALYVKELVRDHIEEWVKKNGEPPEQRQEMFE